jgi:cytochrome oxidase Cu insertion factor (SCO1/SenC/PrrC family)
MSRKSRAKPQNMMKTPLALVAAAALAGLVLAAVLVLATGGVTGTASSNGRADIGGTFSLVTHEGKPVTEQDFRGQYTLYFFGYTFCPDICPGELQTISAALDKLGPDAGRVTPVFVTVDPARDTVSQLAAYVKNFSPRIVGLTGTEEQVRAAAKAFKVYYAKADTGGGGDAYAINHSAYAYLMGPDGRYVTHFAYGITPEKLADGLRKQIVPR